MKITVCKSKIHQARITDCVLHYEGSLEIDMDIVRKAGMFPYEKILIVNMTNGERLETYIIPGEPGSKRFCLNGAAARKGEPGDVITIMSFGIIDEEEAKKGFKPIVVVLNENNEIIKEKK